ncbi:hypothetical protein CKA32_005542 [Geitlerinema sp. FC II]|nr:hypothetical protein CKA32_005542 [Geitlerinema sp. FC II]
MTLHTRRSRSRSHPDAIALQSFTLRTFQGDRRSKISGLRVVVPCLKRWFSGDNRFMRR